MAALWDSVVATASKAAAQAGETTQVVAIKAKLHADILVIDRDIHARKEKFGVEMYAHLQGITSTQEFYVADDRLINIIRPTLIKAQREVAAYERKRDTMRGKVNLVEAERCGTGSIFYAATISEKLYNAAKFAAAGAKEAASKTELAMLERQILGFKEEFGVELYPIFESMEDNEGWLPTDRKVRSLYDCAREDIAKMKKLQEEKREQMLRLDGVEGSGLTPTTVPPTTATTAAPATTNIHATVGIGQTTTSTMPSWASNAMPSAVAVPVGNGYGSTTQPTTFQTPQPSYAFQQHQQQQQQTSQDSGFGFMQSSQPTAVSSSMPQYSSNNVANQQQYPQQQSIASSSQLPSQHKSVFDPFDAIAGPTANAVTSSSAYATPTPASNTAHFDPNSMSYSNNQQKGSGGSLALSDADMNLFKF
ncbi:hypothetical protein ACHAWU_009720 [Discostella pseudostelligera]|uniref:Uncharacterized protein n=1 Tax=Discostella pseudostelligera TaxID=259834 RepID=A0ABD3MQN5_9STRA